MEIAEEEEEDEEENENDGIKPAAKAGRIMRINVMETIVRKVGGYEGKRLTIWNQIGGSRWQHRR